jgi:small subunit ribosomal protein S33
MSLGRFSPAMKVLIAESAARIFGNRPVVPYRTGFKYLTQKPTAPTAVEYYVKDPTKLFKKASKDFATDLEDVREEQLRRFRRKGKGPPKKGQGKRAMKAKAKGAKAPKAAAKE